MSSLPPEGFEIRNFGTDQVYVTTIPKGTLLFRGVRTIDSIREDLFGNGCLAPQHSVYFYPFPFVDVTVDKYSHVVLYVVTSDIKIVVLISPATMDRSNLRSDRTLTSCKNVDNSCGTTPRYADDPCFSPKFLSENRDITGMIGIAPVDVRAINRMIGTPSDKNFKILNTALNRYFTAYKDKYLTGIPEIVLHPRLVRSTQNVITPAVYDIVDWISKNKSLITFAPIHTFKDRSNEAIQSYMDSIVSPEGLNGMHAQIDKRTGFYVMTEMADETTRSHLLDSSDFKSMSSVFPEFRFVRGVLAGSKPVKTFDRLFRELIILMKEKPNYKMKSKDIELASLNSDMYKGIKSDLSQLETEFLNLELGSPQYEEKFAEVKKRYEMKYSPLYDQLLLSGSAPPLLKGGRTTRRRRSIRNKHSKNTVRHFR